LDIELKRCKTNNFQFRNIIKESNYNNNVNSIDNLKIDEYENEKISSYELPKLEKKIHSNDNE